MKTTPTLTSNEFIRIDTNAENDTLDKALSHYNKYLAQLLYAYNLKEPLFSDTDNDEEIPFINVIAGSTCDDDFSDAETRQDNETAFDGLSSEYVDFYNGMKKEMTKLGIKFTYNFLS